MRRAVVGLLLALAFLPPPAHAGEDLAQQPVDELIDLLEADGWVRVEAAEALAGRADARVPAALKARLEVEEDFHARLALHYALARHGERSSVYPLVQSLERTGHLGSVYLGWLVGRFGKDHGWDRDGWKAWIDGVTDETWRGWQARRHLPWVASDADEAGLAEAVAWWDGLGYPDVGSLPFVLVQAYIAREELELVEIDLVENGVEPPPPPPPPPGAPAWLLEDDGVRFRLFTHGLERLSIPHGPPRDWPRRGTYERVDVGAFVRDAIADSPRLEAGISSSDRSTGTPPQDAGLWTASYWGGAGDPMRLAPYAPPDWFRAFPLAVACWKQGAKDAALALWSRLALERPRGTPAPPWKALDYVREAMQEEEAKHLIEAFGDEELTTEDVLQLHRTFLARYGAHDAAEARLRVLERMVAEDMARRTEAPPLKDGTRSLADEVDALVVRLREPGAAIDPTWTLRRPDEPVPETAFSRLVDIGFAAVPRLLAALGDDTLTRSVIEHDSGKMQWEGWMHVERVADVALRALQRISARSFGEDVVRYPIVSGGRGSIVDEGRVDEVREHVEAWWRTCQEKGEAATLAELVGRGGREALESARLLVERHPEAAAAALIEGIPATTDPWARDRLVALLARAPGPETTEFLQREMLGCPTLRSRVAAARALYELDDPMALEAMTREWTQLAAAPTEPGRARGERISQDLIEFLATSGRGEAIRLLMHDVAALPVRVRLGIVDAMRLAAGLEEPFGGPAPAPAPPHVMSAVEDVLLALVLDESEPDQGLQASGPSVRAANPCLGDEAASTLAALWPDRYAFDATGSRAARRRARVAAANVGRRARGEELLPLPPASAAPPAVPVAEAEPLLEAFLGATDEGAQATARRALVERGLGLLPSIVRRLAAVAPDAPERAALQTIAHELGNRVVEVVFDGAGPEPDDAFRKAATSLEGRPLTGTAFVGLLLHVTRDTPPGSVGARITVRRDSDLSGVTLLVRLLDQPAAQPGTQKGWDMHQNLRVGGMGLVGGAGGFSLEYGRKDEAWSDYAAALDQALARPVHEVIEGDVLVRRER
ncbi:MAG: hypothetical protein AB7T63_10480 [Planctomycetota bacterium]